MNYGNKLLRSIASVKIEAVNQEGVWMLVSIKDLETIPSSHALDFVRFAKKKAEVRATYAVNYLMDLERV